MPFRYATMWDRLCAQCEVVPDPAFEQPHLFWQGATRGGGYGYLSVRSRYRYKRRGRPPHRKVKHLPVHRVALALYLGVPVWMLNHVCHTCDFKTCFEPTHLFSSTQRKNVQDCVAKGRHRNGSTGRLPLQEAILRAQQLRARAAKEKGRLHA